MNVPTSVYLWNYVVMNGGWQQHRKKSIPLSVSRLHTKQYRWLFIENFKNRLPKLIVCPIWCTEERSTGNFPMWKTIFSCLSLWTLRFNHVKHLFPGLTSVCTPVSLLIHFLGNETFVKTCSRCEEGNFITEKAEWLFYGRLTRKRSKIWNWVTKNWLTFSSYPKVTKFT